MRAKGHVTPAPRPSPSRQPPSPLHASTCEPETAGLSPSTSFCLLLTLLRLVSIPSFTLPRMAAIVPALRQAFNEERSSSITKGGSGSARGRKGETMGVFAKRHFYECGGETISWHSEWYTQPWFTVQRQSYDSAASTGPVNPPLDVIETIGRCSSLLRSESESLSSILATATGVVITTSRVVESGVVSGSLVPATQTTVFTVAASATSSSASASDTSGTAGASASSTAAGSSSSLISTLSTALSPAAGSSSPVTATAVPAALAASTNACAGDWDWQAWGMVANLGFGVIVGGMLWLSWAILRSRLPGLYAGRTWFVPRSACPSRPWSILGFLLPFLHLPSMSSPAALSEGPLGLHSMLAAFKLAAVPSLIALAAALPLYMVSTPCLNATSPSNNLGGRTGSLSDMSLLRLLNSLDPNPDSDSTASQLHLRPYLRALPSTIAPAIGSARVRLIILLVLIAVLGCGGGLFVLFRAYTTFARYHKRFEQEICGGMDMVIIPSARAEAWKGLSEERIQKWIAERGLKGEDGDMSVAGVFGIPDSSAWKAKVHERDEVLSKLEEAEVKYIDSFRLVQTPSNGRRLEAMPRVSNPGSANSSPRTRANDFIGPKDYYRLSSGRGKAEAARPLEISLPATQTPPPALPSQAAPATPAPGVKESKFREINRDSALFGRLPIGQRVRVNSQGQLSPESSPEDESFNPLGAPGPDASGTSTAGLMSDTFQRQSPRLVPLPPSPEQGADALPHFQPGPERHAEVHVPDTAVAVASQTPSHDSSPLGQHYHDIRAYRSLFKSLNGEIAEAQQKSWTRAAKGEDVFGWVVVGRGVRWIPEAQRVEGTSREDILWENVGQSTGIGLFWAKVAGVAIVVAAIMVPFVGLTIATAPGFAHYFGFLRPLAESDGFGAGVVEGLVPAIASTLAMGGAVSAITRFARQTKVVSRSRQRLLAYQGTFYLTLCTTLLWFVLAAALEFGAQGLVTDVQPSRAVGDGAVFSTWFVFVALLNVAIIAPALYLLQPRRLMRYLLRSRQAITPRHRFRLNIPPSFNPSYALLPFLVAVFYAFSLVFLFPLLALPILLLIFLGLVANRYMVDYVLVERGGYTGATIALWTIRRFGWVLGVQPALYGLILLSRQEWALGGASLGIALITVILSELVTVRRYRRDTARRLSASDRQAIGRMAEDMTKSRDSYPATGSESGRPRTSDASMLSRLAALLPGYSRLPSDCPLPLQTEAIDDLFHTERASYARPSFARKEKDTGNRGAEGAEVRTFFHDPTDSIRGLIYPDEVLAPVPVVWLPNDEAGVAVSEAADLEAYHGLSAIVDPEDVNERRGKEKEQMRRSQPTGDDTRSPLS